MKNEQLWEAAQLAAERIVAAERELWPNSDGVVAFSIGGGESDTSFERSGTSRNDISTLLPTLLSELLSSNASTSAPDAGLASNQRSFLSSLLTRDQSATPGKATLDSTMAIDPQTFSGSPALAVMAGRNPYSTQFENDTNAAYRQRAADALAQVQSGHEAVRGGQSRSAMAQGVMAERLAQGRGQEVRGAQLQDAGIVQGASGLFNSIESGRRGLQLGAQNQLGNQAIGRTANTVDGSRSVDASRGQHSAALDLASRLLGTRSGLVTDSLSGKGNQGTSSWGVNILGGCCFIFLESLNGKLPWFVELARFDYYTPIRRDGYKWMSTWLVPLMRRSRAARWLVNNVMVKPCLTWASFHYGVPGTPFRWLCWPVVRWWFCVWHVLGRTLANRKG